LCLLVCAAAAAIAVASTGGGGSSAAGVTTVAALKVPATAAGSHVRTATLRRAADTVALRARRLCGPGATVRVTLDRRLLIRRRVTSKAWRTLSVAVVVPKGRRRVALTVLGGRTRGCRRPLALGAVRLLATGRTAPTVPSPPPAPAAAPAVSGAAPATTAAPPSAAAPVTAAGSTAGSAAPATTPARPKLAWAPPALSAPTTIAVAQGDQIYNLSTSKDYILKLGAATHVGGLGIKGGRNVEILGGQIALPASSSRANAIGISGAVGTVHIEGVWIDGSSGHEADGIQIEAPKATVQLENLRVTGLRGSYNTNHTDVVQPWGGVGRLRIDRLSGDTNYQGIFDQPDQGAIGPVDLRHVDLTYDNTGAQTGGYLIWLTNGCTAATSTALTEVYVKGRAGSTLGSTVWPPLGGATDCPAKVVANVATWAALAVTGGVRWGAPPGGPFVTAADAGTSYTSPGYG
jgi:hypothetical protein